MAKIHPFRALRPAKIHAGDVISLPYDVMNRKEAAEMAKEKPYSFLHICRSEIDMPEIENPYCTAVYEKAKKNIEEFTEKGVFIQDEKPLLYIYKQIMNDRSQVGIVACASIDDYKNDIIKKHEFTRHEKELDRINHFDICDGNTEPVFLTYRKNDEIANITDKWMKENDPEYDLITDDGISHILWPLTDSGLIHTIVNEFSGIDALYIADGHHRTASAAAVGEKRRKENPNYTGEEEFNYFMAVIFPDDQLYVMDYNRVVTDLNGLSETEFLTAVEEKFDITELRSGQSNAPDKKHRFTMYLDATWYLLEAKDGTFPSEDPVESLDAAILQKNLLDPILGIKDPRTDKRIDFVGGIRGLTELERRIKEGMKVAFALYPVTISDLMKVSDAGQVMPPKSTWFEPKLGSGLFMHLLK